MQLLNLLTPILDIAEVVVPGPLGKIIAGLQAGIGQLTTVTTAAQPLGTAVPAIGTLLQEAAPIIAGIEALLTALAHPASTTTGTSSSDALVPALQELWTLYPALNNYLAASALPVIVPLMEQLLSAIGLFKVAAAGSTTVAATSAAAIASLPTVTPTPIPYSAVIPKPTPARPQPVIVAPTPMPAAGSVPVQPIDNLEGRGGNL